MIFMFTLESHPQDISLGIRKYSQSEKFRNTKHFWTQAFLLRASQPVVLGEGADEGEVP